MVVVAAHHAVDTVDARALPMRLASRDGGLLGEDVTGQAPAAMGFEVGLVDQVDAVLVAQLVPALLVRIVGGPDGVEVVPLAEDHIVDHVLLGDRAAALGIELVAVGALNTMRLPLIVMMPSSMRKRRNPTFWTATSAMLPAWSMTVTSNS